jgi:hypothetical protein
MEKEKWQKIFIECDPIKDTDRIGVTEPDPHRGLGRRLRRRHLDHLRPEDTERGHR